MGQVVWMSGLAVVIALLVGAGIATERETAAEPVAYVDTNVEPQAAPTTDPAVGRAGSALATAAFGLSALQPETFNSEIVRDIIEASPLAYGEKDRLTAKLLAAEAGHAELPRVLADIRVSLAVE